jgi:DNA-binding MarR family transcriptional regulator
MDTSEKSTIREPIGRIMGNISRMFLADLQHQLKHLDIERSFYPLLLIEARNGKMTQQELAGEIMRDKVQVVRIIDYLSLNGYVTRIQDLNDRRKINLEITGKGREILPEIRRAIAKTSNIALANIPEDQIDELYRMIRTIEKNLITSKYKGEL